MQEQKTNNSLVYFLSGILFILPLFVFPFFFNPLLISKYLLLTIASFTVFFTLIFSVLARKQFSLRITPVFWPMISFTISVIVSSLTAQQYPDKQFLGFGGALIMLGMVVLIVPSLIKGDHSRTVMRAINFSAASLSLISIAQAFGIGPAIILNKISILNIPNNLSFSLAGSTIILVQILSATLLADLMDTQTWRKSWLNRLLMLLIAIGLGINIRTILPDNQKNLANLALGPSIEIAKSSLQITKTAFFGHGPESYANAYNILRPIWLNNANYWQNNFETGFNLPLTFIVTLGAVGCLLWLWLLYNAVRSGLRTQLNNNSLKYFVGVLIVWQFLMPIGLVSLSMLLLGIAFIVVANNESDHVKNYNLTFFNQQGEKYEFVSHLFTVSAVLLISLITLALVNISKPLIAYYYVYNASAALANQETVKAYEFWQKAVTLAPKIDSLRRSYAMINLQIAIALSNKTDLTQVEQEQVMQLMNQAIREGKAATALDPNNYQNWVALSQIYSELINSSEQASQETFNALANAVNVNPSNPLLRIELGQLFIKLKKPNDAITFFNQAIERKPDLAQGHYLLAQALQQTESYDEAERALVTTMGLLKDDTQEYQVVQEELKRLKEIKAKVADQKRSQAEQPTEAASQLQPTSNQTVNDLSTQDLVGNESVQNDVSL